MAGKSNLLQKIFSYIVHKGAKLEVLPKKKVKNDGISS
jgi:hypothetical protein